VLSKAAAAFCAGPRENQQAFQDEFTSDEKREAAAQEIPLRRESAVQEVADPVLFLASLHNLLPRRGHK
jgi:NAD(P)-dependent dehydrogenase (short-subunit alcohol dehydrogenase family)